MTINWLIERLLVKPTEGSLTDVVITADWRCNGSQDQYSGTCYGSASFAPPTENFTPYPDLTEQQVLEWCFSNGVDKTAIEANVTQQINDQINPPIITPPLPWPTGGVPAESLQAPPKPVVANDEPVVVASDLSVSDASAA